MSTQFKVCNCNGTMPLNAAAGEKLAAAIGEKNLPVATQLCRREVGAFLPALDGVDDVVVACTQERALFSELAQQKQSVAPLRFVNIRETGGWSREGKDALPKMAALLAAAALPDPEPVPTVDYESGGHVLIIGPAERALPWAQRLQQQVAVSVLLTQAGNAMLGERTFPVYSGSDVRLKGWLGAFEASWVQGNPIDLETCTRCNACIEVCPEQAIDLTYQIDLEKCSDHRDCVKACAAIGAINFVRDDRDRKANFDLIFDLSDAPLIASHQLPQGYFAPGGDMLAQGDAALKLTQLVGEFSKPKFFVYKEKLCAHGRNNQVGCNLCVEVCSADAISSKGNLVHVTPQLCVGCGACTTVCPSGALAYAYPRAPETGKRMRTMLETYRKAGGIRPALLLHSQNKGSDLLLKLGRLAKTSRLKGVPARVLPMDLHHSASTGIDVWLSAVAYGASNLAILITDEEAPQYVAALQSQIDIAQTILNALGYAGRHLSLIRANNEAELDAALSSLAPAQAPAQFAVFNLSAEKRSTLDLAISHLHKHAPTACDEIPLPAASPFGAILVDTAKCTLCMACVGACPEAALADNDALPQLRFIEHNCVQCGLCEKTCPEDAISLQPRLLLTETARQAVVLNEAQPFHCVRCSKPIGTAQMVERMIAKIGMHGAFAGKTERLKMCADCRVIDMVEENRQLKITDLNRF